MVRKAVNMSTVALTIVHEKSDAGVETITVDQGLGSGAGATTETRILDWETRQWESKLLGPTVVRARRVRADELDNAWLTQGWVAKTLEHGLILNDIKSEPKNGKSWHSQMVRHSLRKSIRNTKCLADLGHRGCKRGAEVHPPCRVHWFQWREDQCPPRVRLQ